MIGLMKKRIQIICWFRCGDQIKSYVQRKSSFDYFCLSFLEWFQSFWLVGKCIGMSIKFDADVLFIRSVIEKLFPFQKLVNFISLNKFICSHANTDWKHVPHWNSQLGLIVMNVDIAWSILINLQQFYFSLSMPCFRFLCVLQFDLISLDYWMGFRSKSFFFFLKSQLCYQLDG